MKMNNSNDLISWVEGYLDACKNRPNSSQIREIRKKISEFRKSESSFYSSLVDSVPTPPDQVIPARIAKKHDLPANSQPLNEETQKLVESVKNATTMEELENEFK